MHSLNLLSLLMASTSLVRAIPHARNPAPYPLHRRVVNIQPLDERSIIDGKCGGGAGSCGAGYCCSQWGYCGTTDDYCGSGCQSSFGSCHVAVPNKANPGPAVSNAAPAAGTAAITSTFAAIAPSQILSTAASAPTPSAAASGSGSGSGYGSGSSSGSSSGGSAYKMYTGDGTVGAGWPAQNAWIDFDSMWNANVPAMQTSCQRLWSQADNTNDNIQAIKSAIETESASCGVDKRFILAIVMQESAGCVRVPTTFGSISNPGLMQSHGGSGTCYNESNCPDSAVLQMIKDGTSGTPTDGLQQCIAQTGVSDVSKYYKAARIYNSGSIASSGDLGQGIATHCYSSDIANRLTGWVDAPTACNLN